MIEEIKEEEENEQSEKSIDQSMLMSPAQANEHLNKMNFRSIPGSQTINKDGIIRYKYLQSIKKEKMRKERLLREAEERNKPKEEPKNNVDAQLKLYH